MTIVNDTIQCKVNCPFKGVLPAFFLRCGRSNTPTFHSFTSIYTHHGLGSSNSDLSIASTFRPSFGLWILHFCCFFGLWVNVSAWAAPNRKGSQWESLLRSVPWTPSQFRSRSEVSGRFHSTARELQMLHRRAQLLTAADVSVWVHRKRGPGCRGAGE